ncbi:uncharacterized protein LOC110837890 isoform X2 [Zootermopsis nevadensis]|uniref:uncharacterized protein LOC110837890 isoform X2 n=1 Tax=Zootermopsis nevadensis TaxID=136037 RepID=UPI000B8EE756|nr:uncharacterized protein LOC110837890 isoform X2 [Zootermopsis nevadensis]
MARSGLPPPCSRSLEPQASMPNEAVRRPVCVQGTSPERERQILKSNFPACCELGPILRFVLYICRTLLVGIPAGSLSRVTGRNGSRGLGLHNSRWFTWQEIGRQNVNPERIFRLRFNTGVCAGGGGVSKRHYKTHNRRKEKETVRAW